LQARTSSRWYPSSSNISWDCGASDCANASDSGRSGCCRAAAISKAAVAAVPSFCCAAAPLSEVLVACARVAGTASGGEGISRRVSWPGLTSRGEACPAAGAPAAQPTSLPSCPGGGSLVSRRRYRLSCSTWGGYACCYQALLPARQSLHSKPGQGAHANKKKTLQVTKKEVNKA
jgi:hypothetical protein